MDGEIFGIDFGLINSYIAIWMNNKAEIVPNDFGRFFPSIITFYKKEKYAGHGAKTLIKKNPKNTIYNIRKLIGKKYNDPEIQQLIKTLPYKIIKDNKSDKIKIEIEDSGIIKKYYPEEILSIILSNLKKIAEEFRGKKCNNLVITVPVYFNNEQRESIKNSCKLAGLNLLNIIDEPIAACYACEIDLNVNKNILVFSIGTKEINITILSLKDKKFQIIGFFKDDFGGDDFTDKLVEICVEEIKEDTGIDISNDTKKIERLKYEQVLPYFFGCEPVKIYLSSFMERTICIENLIHNHDFIKNVTRAEFEEICKDYFSKCINLIEQTLKNCHYQKEFIDEVICVGNSTLIPMIKEMISNYFTNIPNYSIPRNEVYAIGATIKGNVYNGIDEIIRKEE